MDKFVNNKITGKMEPWIETSQGNKFWYNNDDLSAIEIEDIAASLSKICRFTGHCNRFYSVAEHSLHVAYILPKNKQLWGLLHDASEAYISDLPAPVKQLLPEYKNLETQIMLRIAKKFNLPEYFWEDPEVKLADWSQLKREAMRLLPSQGENWYFPKNLVIGRSPLGLSSERTYVLFLEAYDEYSKFAIRNY